MKKQVGKGERRWPMAAAILLAGLMRTALPSQLRVGDAPNLFLAVLVVALLVLILGDPGRIDRQATWLRILTISLIGLITIVNGGSSIRLGAGIYNGEPFTNDPHVLLLSGGIIWLTNVIAFGLW